eukprot:scaffold92477_cov53-Phaeocystis_antarctica.AAC.2
MLDTLRTRQFRQKDSRSQPPKEKIIHSKHNGFMNTREDTAIHTAPQHQHVDRLTPIPPPQAAAMAPIPASPGLYREAAVASAKYGRSHCAVTVVRAALEVPPECGLCRELLKAALPRRLPTR